MHGIDHGRKEYRHAYVFLIVSLLLASALCPPVLATRDVKIGLTELKPSLYTNDQGKPAGFFVDVLTDIAAREDWNIIWVSGTLSETWERLNSSQIDLMPAVADTPDRGIFFDFSHEPALSVWSQVYARPGSGISTILDLDGKQIAMVRGSSSGIAFKDYSRKFGINATFLEMATPADVFSATARGTADALIVYNTAGQEDARTYGLTTTPVMFNPTPLVFAVRKGENQDLLSAIDRNIAEGKRSPSSPYSQAMLKWYGIGSNPVVPPWILWGLGIVIFVAVLFVIMSYILQREVGRKTAELYRQKEEIQAAYQQLTSTEEELREKYTELAMSERALGQARKKLQQLITLTGQDLRTGVFSLAGYLALAKGARSPETAREYLDKSEEALHSIENSLKVAKKYSELGLKKPAWQEVNIVFLNAISHMDLSAVSRSIELDDLEIFADPLLEDVFYTLMENVTTHGRGVTEIRMRYTKNPGTGITLRVEDNGAGIAASEKEKIFERDDSRKAGMGLYLVREILSITDITIRETGEPGAGARFEIAIPEGRYRFGKGAA